jgi:stage II sporulation protein D
MNLKKHRLTALIILLLSLLALALPMLAGRIYKKLDVFPVGKSSDITLFLHEKEEKIELSFNEYLLGVLLTQIDKDYHNETLRAAVVASRSALLYMKGACRHLCNADSDYCDCESSFRYIDREEYEKDNGSSLSNKLSEIIRESDGEILLYEDSYALALIHRSSYVTTESSYEVYKRSYPYLEPVITAEKPEIKEFFILESEILPKLGKYVGEKYGAGIPLSPSLKLSRTGRVDSVNLCMCDIPASEFTEIFGIPSRSFEIKEAYGGLVITSYGIGNGVGMSLMGADKMCSDGFSYRDVLLYYFKGCKIISEN